MDAWRAMSHFEPHDRNKLRWLLRHAAQNGIVEAGVAVKFGREWRINAAKLPEFLRQQTLASLSGGSISKKEGEQERTTSTPANLSSAKRRS